jgi:hypothetical protein
MVRAQILAAAVLPALLLATAAEAGLGPGSRVL